MNFIHKISQYFSTAIVNELSRSLLWIPVLLGLGAFLAISFYDNLSVAKITVAVVLFLWSFWFYWRNRQSYRSFIFAALAWFFCGFLFTVFYLKCANNYTQVTGKIFVDVRAKVEDVAKFSNKINHHEGMNLVLSQLSFYKSEFHASSKTKKRPRKIDEKFILKNFMNVGNYQQIDREFLNAKNNYQSVNWIEKDGREAYPRPPAKISVISQRLIDNLQIGDEIFFRAVLAPPKFRQFVDDFDFSFNAKTRGIGAVGYAIGEIVVIKKSHISSFDEFFAKLRKKIEVIILQDLQGDKGTISAALLMGNQNLIAKDTMAEIRNSGLVHLISISGLHLSLAAGIFFFTARFLLSRSEFLALRFDIKKIAAIIAILSSYFYLKIAGSPVPAVRSFVAVLLVMLAIIFDRKIDGLRSIMLGAFVLILLNPYNIFSISFQLSFAAMLALVAIHEVWTSSKFKPLQPTKIQKFAIYFFEMTLISTAAQIATAPFIIYYFGDVSVYGALSNLIAIPLTSFTTMPLGFLSFFLMPFGLEKIALVPMGITVEWVVDIAKFVSGLSYSHFYAPQMPKIGLAFAVFGGLICCLCSNKLKPVGALIFALSFFSLSFVKQPNLLIDGEGKLFAIYSKENGLVFSKNLRPSRKRELWMKKMRVTEFQSFSNFSEESLTEAGIICAEDACALRQKDKNILVLLQRSSEPEICQNKFDVIVNLTRKYAIPRCIDKNKTLVIDNLDLLKKGTHFLYFEKDQVRVRAAN